MANRPSGTKFADTFKWGLNTLEMLLGISNSEKAAAERWEVHNPKSRRRVFPSPIFIVAFE